VDEAEHELGLRRQGRDQVLAEVVDHAAGHALDERGVQAVHAAAHERPAVPRPRRLLFEGHHAAAAVHRGDAVASGGGHVRQRYRQARGRAVVRRDQRGEVDVVEAVAGQDE
jgi:hypothetical protein